MRDGYSVWSVPIFKADANDAWNEIRTLNEITPEGVVNLARNPGSCIHGDFEWDDAVAGEKYRIVQAQKMIRCLKVVVKTSDKKKEPQTFRILQKTSKSHVFKTNSFFVSNKSEYERLLEQALRELKGFRERYKKLAELESVFEAIDEL